MSDDIQSRFDQVRLSYIDNLKKKRSRIKQLWNNLSNDWQTDEFDELHLHVHSIAGGAETFGFAEVSKTARTAVNLIRATEKHTPLDKTGENFQNLNIALIELDKVLTSAVDG